MTLSINSTKREIGFLKHVVIFGVCCDTGITVIQGFRGRHTQAKQIQAETQFARLHLALTLALSVGKVNLCARRTRGYTNLFHSLI